MDDIKYRDRIRSAVQRPPAPAALVERTRQSAIAVEAGKAAREKMRAPGVSLGEQYTELAAQVAVGKLATGKIFPVGVTAEALTRQLVQNPAFQKEMSLPAEKLLKSIEDGSLLRRVSQKLETGKKTHIEQPVRKKQNPPQL